MTGRGRGIRTRRTTAATAQQAASPPPPTTTTKKVKKPTAAQNAKDIAGIYGELKNISALFEKAQELVLGSSGSSSIVIENNKQQDTAVTSPNLTINNELVNNPNVGNVEQNMAVVNGNLQVTTGVPAHGIQNGGRGRARATASNPSFTPIVGQSTHSYNNDLTHGHNVCNVAHPSLSYTAECMDQDIFLDSVANQQQDFTRPRGLPYSTSDLQEEGLQQQVSRFITANMLATPTAGRGKTFYAHAHIKRGRQKKKTDLGELKLSEYNFGLHQMLKEKALSVVEKRCISKHIVELNFEAMSYDWDGVRDWSEEVCYQIAEGNLQWENKYRIDSLKGEIAHRSPVGAAGSGDEGKNNYSMSAEVKAANHAPPCRQFNNGTCTFSRDHVVNGYRHLHICSTCIYAKCSFLDHPEKTCRVKLLRDKKRAQDKPDNKAGFGN